MAEYAQCPNCESDGPHTRVDEATLECGNCFEEFADPFVEEYQGPPISEWSPQHHELFPDNRPE